MTTKREDVEFKTLDGLLLKGWLYPASKSGPGVIMTPGFNCTKEDFYPGLADHFQRAGITVLIYDPRNTGQSEGFPRNEIDPQRQAEDYSDAFTFLSTLPLVDSSRIAFWGVSLTACIVLASGALDKRAAAVISVAPLFHYDYMTGTEWNKVVSKTLRDRESQLLHGNPPFYIPALESRGVVPRGSRMNPPSADSSRVWHNPHASTIQSYYKMAMWQPVPLASLQMLPPTPVMFMTPEHDTISKTQIQLDLFATIQGPKKLHLALGKEHVNVLSGDDLPALTKVQIDFLWHAVEGRLHGQGNGVPKTMTNGEWNGPTKDTNINGHGS